MPIAFAYAISKLKQQRKFIIPVYKVNKKRFCPTCQLHSSNFIVNRRVLLKTLTFLVSTSCLGENRLVLANEAPITFPVKPLPYSYDALEPYIDEETMRLHHDKHYATYAKMLNEAIANITTIEGNSEEDLLHLLANYRSIRDPTIREKILNHGGGYVNHDWFFRSLSGKPIIFRPQGALMTDIVTEFQSFDHFKDEFTNMSLSLFGSGWAWLYWDHRKSQLSLANFPNQDSPAMNGDFPILGLDLWEHAYYLKYNNRRGDYIAAWWNIIDWPMVCERYAQFIKRE
eukprot:jgi/Galph1/3061/GphlegSOOS_G1727.1